LAVEDQLTEDERRAIASAVIGISSHDLAASDDGGIAMMSAICVDWLATSRARSARHMIDMRPASEDPLDAA
jgi:hypothetical protein